ncbi:glycosyltransferase [bacterium]|nr:glycosyltransferase [bacterium]
MELIGFILWVLSCIALAFVIWNIRAWPAVQLPPKIPPETPDAAGDSPSVSILIPCRDEEHNLPFLLESLHSQGSRVREILILDDESSDGTAGVIRRYGLMDRRIRLLSGRERPEGWFGKTWACHQLSEEASGDWLLFLDADVRLQRGAVDAMLAEAQSRELGFLSCWPHFETVSAAEQLAIPLLNFATFTSFPMGAMHRSMHPGMVVASGACLLMEAAAYKRVDGHRACAGGLLEDHALARAFRECGERSLTLDGSRLLSVRMYRDIHEVANGFRKNLYKVLRNGPCFWAFFILQLGLFSLPLYVAACQQLAGQPQLHMLMCAANVLMIRLLLAAAYRTPVWSALMHGLAMPGMLWVAILSFHSIALGGGVQWKGRTYFAETGPQHVTLRRLQALFSRGNA